MTPSMLSLSLGEAGAWLGLAGVAVALGAGIAKAARRRLSALRRRRRARRKTERLHRRHQAAAARALLRLREIDPKVNPARAFGYLRAVNPLVFEEMVLTVLERRGLRIERSARYTGDGGADGSFALNGRAWLIQDKRYCKAISPQHVKAFEDLCRRSGARGLFIHTGRTGPGARAAEAAAPSVRILSGSDLLAFFAGEEIGLKRVAARRPACYT